MKAAPHVRNISDITRGSRASRHFRYRYNYWICCARFEIITIIVYLNLRGLDV